MTVWYAARTVGRAMGWRGKALFAAGVLAVLLVAAVPAAFFVGLIFMLLGHVVVGLAIFGASILAAVAAVTIAIAGGMGQLRRLASQLDPRIGRTADQDPRDPQDPRVVRLGRSDYDVS